MRQRSLYRFKIETGICTDEASPWPADLCFWRDNHGLEVDLVFEHRTRLHAVEIKSGATFLPETLDAARRWQALAGADAAPPLLVYGGSESFEFKGRNREAVSPSAPAHARPHARR